MKKVILLLAITLLTLSCGSDDDGLVIRSNISFDPPTWIQGTWFEVNEPNGFTFTLDDIITLNLDQSNNIVDEFSIKEFYSRFEGVNRTQVLDDNRYKAEVISSNGAAIFSIELIKKATDTITFGPSFTYVRQ